MVSHRHARVVAVEALQMQPPSCLMPAFGSTVPSILHDVTTNTDNPGCPSTLWPMRQWHK